MNRTGVFFVLYLCLLAARGVAAADAIANPTGSAITIVVRTAPGSVTDALVRLLARPMSMLSSQPVVVANRPGTGAAAVAGGGSGDAVTIVAINSESELPAGVFKPLALIARNTLVSEWYAFVVPASTPDEVVRQLGQVIDAALARTEIAQAMTRASLQPVGGPPQALEDVFAVGRAEASARAKSAEANTRRAPDLPASAKEPIPQPLQSRTVAPPAPNDQPAPAGGDPIQITVSLSSKYPALRITNRGPWAIWGRYYLTKCVNTTDACQGEHIPGEWATGPKTYHTTNWIMPVDECKPMSFMPHVEWTYLKTVNGKHIKVQGRTDGPEFGPYLVSSEKCAKKATAAARPGVTQPAPSRAGSAPASTPSTAGTAAPSAPTCGRVGEVIFVRSPEAIPPSCRQNREDNWAADGQGNGVAASKLCASAVTPYDNGNLIPASKIRNMSGCFCLGNPGASAETASSKCWTFYERAY